METEILTVSSFVRSMDYLGYCYFPTSTSTGSTDFYVSNYWSCLHISVVS